MKRLIIGLLLVVCLLVAVSCGPTITEDQAYIMVTTRLTNLAQTPEAKEYVGAFLSLPSIQREYEAESQCWVVQITGVEVELVMTRGWFPDDPDDPDYIDTFRDDHWWEAVWLVQDDGRITPIGKGLIVEADIDRLNLYRTLRSLTAPVPAPESELALYEAYKAIETRLNGMATNSEAQRYLADFMYLSEGFWEINYVQEYKIYYVTAKAIRSSTPKTYYYQSYWSEAMWVLDSGGHISPDANARRIEADLLELGNGGIIEPNPNYYQAPVKKLYQRIEYTMPSGALSGSSISYTKTLEAGEKVDGFVELTGKYYSIDWSYKWYFEILGPGGESIHDWEGHWVNTPHHDLNFTPSYAGKYTIRVSHASSYSKNLVIEIWPPGWGYR